MNSVYRHNNNLFVRIGAVMLVLCVGYCLFSGIDRLFLRSFESKALIEAKEHRPPGKTYSTQIIGGRTQVIPYTTGDYYLLRLRINSKTAYAAVEKGFFDSVQPGAIVMVVCRSRRLSGALEVVEVKKY